MPWQLSLLFRLAVYNLCEFNGFWGSIYVADFCELSYAQAVTHHLCPVWCIYVCMCPVLVTLVFVNLSPVHSLSVPVNVLCSVIQYRRIYACTRVQYIRTYVYIYCGCLTNCTGVMLGLWYTGSSYCVELYPLYYSASVTTCQQWHCHCVNVPYNKSDSVTSPLAKTVSLFKSSWWSILVSKLCV